MKLVIPKGSEDERAIRIAAHFYATEKDGVRGLGFTAFVLALIKDEPEAKRAWRKVHER